MEKILHFAMILTEEVRRINKMFNVLDKSLMCFDSAYDMILGTTLRLKGNKYIRLENIWEDMELDDISDEVDEDDKNLADYLGDDEDVQQIEGILLGNDFLYEAIYDYGMLGEKFIEDENNQAVKILVRTLHKIASAFSFQLEFMDGRIYIRNEKRHLDDGGFICKNMKEVEAVCGLAKGLCIVDVREQSGMSSEEFDDFMERLKQHEDNQCG